MLSVAKVNTGRVNRTKSTSPKKIQPNPVKVKKKRTTPTEEKANTEPTKARPRLLSIIQDWKTRTSNSVQHRRASIEEAKEESLLDDDIYEGLDINPTLLIHGLESDWIEEEMSDDDDFK